MGHAERVRSRLLELKVQLEVDEFIVTSHIAEHHERLLSYRSVAEALT